MKKNITRRLLAFLLCAALTATLMTGLTACKKKEADTPDTTPTENDEEYNTIYAVDELINRFFTEYVEDYGDEVYNPHRDPADVKAYIATINECTVTVRNVADTKNGLHIIIQGGHTEKTRNKMMNTFSKIACSIDASCTVSMVNEAVNHLVEQTATVNDYRLSNYVKVLHYSPINEEVGVPCRIELLAMNYLLPSEE